MKHQGQVTYPKKRSRLRLENLADAAEPQRQSLYQTLQNNLKTFDRATFLHRIIYVGEHKFESYEQAKDVFYGTIKKCNEAYCIEKLSGFLLYYNRFFIHVVEGDEDNINKHLSLVLDENSGHYEFLKIMKLLTHVSNINQRLIENWAAYTEVPSKLLETLDVNADVPTAGRWVFNCIKKVYALVKAYVDNSSEDQKKDTEQETERSDIEVSTTDYQLNITVSQSSKPESVDNTINTETTQRCEYRLFLPEYELLDFIVSSNLTLSLEYYFKLYGVVPMLDVYKDKVWPVPHDFVPYDIFEKPFDCVTELPKEVRKRQHLDASPQTEIVGENNVDNTENQSEKDNLNNASVPEA